MVRGRKNLLSYGLGQRLRRIREAAGIPQIRLIVLSGCSRGQVSRLEAELNIPALDTVERLAVALGIPPGWLAFGPEGAEAFQRKRSRSEPMPEDPKPDVTQRPISASYRGCGARLRSSRRQAGLGVRRLATAAGVSAQAILNCEQGDTVPKIDNLELIAMVLGVAPAWLAYGEDSTRRTSKVALWFPATTAAAMR